MSKAVFCDLDSTLLARGNQISPYSAEKIREMNALGHHFIICTGRHPGNNEMISKLLGMQIKDFICTNGAVTMANGEYVLLKELPLEVRVKAGEICLNRGVSIVIFDPHGSTVFKNGVEKETMEKQRVLEDPEDFFTYIKREDIIINKYMLVGEHEDLLQIREDLQKELEGKVVLTFSEPYLLEIVPFGIDKGLGIDRYCEAMHIDLKDTIGIGDSENDIKMLKKVSLATCVGNANQPVKEICDYVATRSCIEGGVGEIIEKFVLEGE